MESFLYQLQKFDPGMVWLDKHNIITAMNEVAMETLGDNQGKLVGQEILQLHPQKSRDKVALLLSSAQCPMPSPPPMTMMINIPDRILLIKVARMSGEAKAVIGTCMIFYDLTDLTTIAREPLEASQSSLDTISTRQLLKLPVYADKQMLLIDLKEVCFIKANGHYSTLYTKGKEYFCNLSLQDMQSRLDQQQFIRTHRSYIINLAFAKALDLQTEHCELVMDCQPDTSVPISRSNVAKVKQIFGIIPGCW